MNPLRESIVLSSVRELLDLLQADGTLFYFRCHVGPVLRSTPRGSVWTKNSDMKGLPDLFVFLKAGRILRTLFIEVKRNDGKLSDGQKEFRDKVERIGGHYHIVRSQDDLVEVLEHHGVRHWAYPIRQKRRSHAGNESIQSTR